MVMSNLKFSPSAPDPSIVTSDKHFSDMLTLDLTDEEIKQAFALITKIKNKWRNRFIYKFNDMSQYTSASHAAEAAAKMVDEFEHELHETLAEKLDLMVVVDMSPVFDRGEGPIVELVGALPSHSSAKYGMDHERKQREVREAVSRGEDYLGQKYDPNPESSRQKSLKSERKRRQDLTKNE